MIDGPTLLGEALDAGVTIVEVYAESGAGPEMVERALAAGIPVRRVAAGALAKATSPVTPQHIAALATMPAPPGDAVLHGLVLVLVGVADPGNAGTLLRVAEAAGASAVVSCADAVDMWNPKCVRAAAGSLFRVPVLVVDGDATSCCRRLRDGGMTLVASALGGAASHEAADLTGDVAVLLGNEAHGLDDGVVALADQVVTIPMSGRVESLNVAMTGTVLAFESARQRRVVREDQR